MKVGVHAKESLEDIIARKTKEIDDAGFALWGYGGNSCHPTTMVQPFAKHAIKTGPIYLCMEKMNSKHFAEPVRADLFSADGINYEPIPTSINVLGSRFALAIKDLRLEEFELSLSRTTVALGRSKGKNGSAYIKGQNDKGCLEITPEQDIIIDPVEPVRSINLVAELCEPYAVFLKNY